MSTSAPVAAGSTFVASIPSPPGSPDGLGARIETPVVAAIVATWQPSAYTLDQNLEAWASVTLQAPPTAGAYLVHWVLADGTDVNPPAFVPLTVLGTLADTTVEDWPPIDEDAVRPDVDAVALLERTRTIDQATGEEVGQFTANTRPTAAQVESFIDAAVEDVLSELRPWIDPARYRQLRKVIAFYAASLVEGSFFGEQVRESGNTVMWWSEYQDALKNLQAQIERDLTEHNLLGTMEPRDTAILA